MKNETINLKNFFSGMGYFLLFLIFTGIELKAGTISTSEKTHTVSRNVKWAKLEKSHKPKETEALKKDS